MEERMGPDFFADEIDFLEGGFLEPDAYRGRLVCFVMDFSLSARGILPAMALTCYDIMNECLLRDGKQTLFGLVIYGNGEERAPFFSDNPSMILEQMLAARSGGGSKNGVEDTAAALRLACESMQTAAPEGEAQLEVLPENRILFLFTDSPSAENVNLRGMLYRDKMFTECPPVRAAVLFVPAESAPSRVHASRYQLPMVDGEGRPDRHRAPYIIPLERITQKRVLQDEDQSEAWISQLLAVIGG